MNEKKDWDFEEVAMRKGDRELIQAKIELADLICNDNEFIIKSRNIEGLTMDGMDILENLISKIKELEQQ